MVRVQFPYNPLLSYMEYIPVDKESGELILYFKKKKGVREARIYAVSQEIAYQMVYCKTAKMVLERFNQYIKNKAQVLEVKTLK